MGVNAVNTMADRVGEIGRGRFIQRIRANEADLRLPRDRAVFAATALGGPEVVDNMVHAALADADPYRVATHDKGAS